jgi:hypothetical protein
LFGFGHCDKTSDINNLKGGIIYFGSQFQRFQSIMLGRE